MGLHCLDSGLDHPPGTTRRNCRDCRDCKRVYQQQFRGRHHPKLKKSERIRYQENKDTAHNFAKMEVYKAVRRGDLPRVSTQICIDCEAPAACWEHRDYLKPLDVEPVCTACNKARGPASF